MATNATHSRRAKIFPLLALLTLALDSFNSTAAVDSYGKPVKHDVKHDVQHDVKHGVKLSAKKHVAYQVLGNEEKYKDFVHRRHGPPGSMPRVHEPTIAQSSYYVTATAKFVCTAGYHLKGESCVSSAIVGPTRREERCPSGWNPVVNSSGDLECEGFEVADVESECAEGYDAEDGDDGQVICLKRSDKPINIRCPDLYKVRETNCVRDIEFPITFECPDGYKMENNECTATIRTGLRSGCPAGYIEVDEECHLIERKAANINCGYGTLLSPEMCIRFKYEEPKKTCPSGGTLTDEGCSSLIIMDICEPNEHTCQDPSVECPPSCDYDGAECRCYFYEQPEVACNPTYTYNASTGSCEQKMTYAPSLSCPSGFTVVGNECSRLKDKRGFSHCAIGSQEGPYCLHRSTLPRIPVCREGGKAVEQRSGEFACIERDEVPWKMDTCDEGFLSQRKCIDFYSSKPINICPIGYAQLGSICAMKVTAPPTVVGCPPGSQDPSNCIRSSIPPTPICPPLFHYDAVARDCYKLAADYAFENEVPLEALAEYLAANNWHNSAQLEALTNTTGESSMNATTVIGDNTSTDAETLDLDDVTTLDVVPSS